MRILAYGAGGVGGYFGGRLAQAGEEVIFVARDQHLRALQTEGLYVESIKGDFHVQPVHAVEDPAQVGQVDFVLVAVKAWQVPEAALQIRSMIGPETWVVPLQNGVDAPGQLAAVLGWEHVLGGMCRIASQITSPGHIRHVGIDPYITFGEMGGGSAPGAERLKEAFERAGVNAEVSADIRAALWQKFAFIASLSGVGAVTRAPAGVVRRIPETRRMLEEAVREVAAVGRRHGVALPEGLAEKTMVFIDGLPEGTLASMQRDIQDGRPSELASQSGAVVRLGLEVGTPTPVHEFCYNSLLPLELKARSEVEW